MDKISYFYVFFQSNAWEILVNIGFYVIFLKLTKSALNIAAMTTYCNLITHPLVFFFFMTLKLSYLEVILIAEAFAVIAEGFLVSYVLSFSFYKALGISLLANLLSWQIPPMINYFVIEAFRQ